MKLRVVPEARSLKVGAVRGHAAVVIDTLRATTSIAYAVAGGAKVEPVRSLAEARRRRGANTFLVGERGGKPVPGFDFGNSPVALRDSALRGKRLVLTTTNGTGAIARCEGAKAIYAGALVNARAIAASIAKGSFTELFLVCAGRTTGIALEDLLGAGAILDALLGKDADPLPLSDGARIALELFRRERARLHRYIVACESGRNLTRLGSSDDVALCAQLDVLDVAPRLFRGQFIDG